MIYIFRHNILILQLIFLIKILTPLAHANFSETEIGGLYNRFKDEYKYLSPVNGLLIIKSNSLNNIRFYGNYGKENPEFLCHKQITHPGDGHLATSDKDCPQDNTTAIIQHLFPSPTGGQLVVSNAEADFFKYVTIEQLGTLLSFYANLKGDTQDKNNTYKVLIKIKGKINQKTLSTIAHGWKHLADKGTLVKLLENYAKMLVGAKQEAQDYPPHLVESALLALAYKKAANVRDLDPLLAELKNFQKENYELSKQPFSKDGYESFKNNVVFDQRIRNEEFKELLKDPEALIFNTLSYDKYEDPFPPIITMGFPTYKGQDFSDCGETSLRNFLNLMLMDKDNRNFKVDRLRKAFPRASRELLKFYEEKQPTYESVIDTQRYNDWAQVVSQLDDGEGLKINYKKQGICEIAGTGFDNMFAVIERLFNDPDLTNIRIQNKDDIARRKIMLNYILGRFSLDNNSFDWSVSGISATTGEQEIPSNDFDLAIVTNDGSKFTWKFMDGHFIFDSNSSKDVQFDWRKNNQDILLSLIDTKDFSKYTLMPFYMNIGTSTIYALKSVEDNYLIPTILYGSPLLEKMKAIATITQLTNTIQPSVRNIIKKWIENFISDDQDAEEYLEHDSKVRVILYYLKKHISEWDNFFTDENFPKAFHLTRLALSRLEKAPNRLFSYIGYSFAEPLILEVITKLTSDQLEIQTKYNPSFLYSAVRYGHKEVVNYLLDKAPQLTIDKKFFIDKNEKTPIHLAATNGDLAILELLTNRAQFAKNIQFMKDKNGKTALHYAATKGYSKVVKLFLREIPELIFNETLAKDKKGNTPIYFADLNGHFDVVAIIAEAMPRTLLEYSKKQSALQRVDIIDAELAKKNRPADNN